MPTPDLIDAHSHLDFEVFDIDRDEVLQRAAENHISNIIIPGTQKKYWARIERLCSSHKNLHPCYGLHPYWVNQHTQHNLDDLRKYIRTNKPVAVGECGLDFRTQQADKKTQLDFFEGQLKIALDYQLPAVIHSVKATETVIETLKKYKNITGMIHSYSGSHEQAKQLIDLGFYISVGGSVTYERANKIKKTVTEIPLTSLLLETDAPDQTDKSNQSKRNEPSFLINTLKTISELREESYEEIAEQTTVNAKKLFKL